MSFFHKVTDLPYTNCQRCYDTKSLFIVSPVIPESDVGAFICDNCLYELASFAGYVTKEIHEETVAKLQETIEKQENELKIVPDLIRKVIDGTNSILSDFITSVAGVTSVDKHSQPEDIKANNRGFESRSSSPKSLSNEHKQNLKASVKSTEH